MCKRKKKITDKEIEIILKKYAKENDGKYGTDEEMLSDLRKEFNKAKNDMIPAN